MDANPRGLCETPQEPSTPQLSVSSDNEVTVSWNAATDGVKYEVVWDNGSFWESDPRESLAVTERSSFTTERLGSLVTYRFAVRAVSECGQSNYSPSASIYVP